MQKRTPNVCCLYRTKTLTETDRADMESQRSVCFEFIDKQGWNFLREFWEKEGALAGSENGNDALIELRAGADLGKFDVLLMSKFDRLGRVPLECSFAAGYFEQRGVEVWSVEEGHIGLFVKK